MKGKCVLCKRILHIKSVWIGLDWINKDIKRKYIFSITDKVIMFLRCKLSRLRDFCNKNIFKLIYIK